MVPVGDNAKAQYLLVSFASMKRVALKQHMILGTDKRDAERQKNLWLEEHPGIKVLKVHSPSREQNLLARIGGKRVPQVSITVDYEEPEAGSPPA